MHTVTEVEANRSWKIVDWPEKGRERRYGFFM
jgi:hypothetical protein